MGAVVLMLASALKGTGGGRGGGGGAVSSAPLPLSTLTCGGGGGADLSKVLAPGRARWRQPARAAGRKNWREATGNREDREGKEEVEGRKRETDEARNETCRLKLFNLFIRFQFSIAVAF